MTISQTEIVTAVAAARKAVDAGHEDAAELLTNALQLMLPAVPKAKLLMLALEQVSRMKVEASKIGGAA